MKFQDADIDLIFVSAWKKKKVCYVTFRRLEHLLKIDAPLTGMTHPFSSGSNWTKIIFAVDPSVRTDR